LSTLQDGKSDSSIAADRGGCEGSPRLRSNNTQEGVENHASPTSTPANSGDTELDQGQASAAATAAGVLPQDQERSRDVSQRDFIVTPTSPWIRSSSNDSIARAMNLETLLSPSSESTRRANTLQRANRVPTTYPDSVSRNSRQEVTGKDPFSYSRSC
jgi:hypothetical protein